MENQSNTEGLVNKAKMDTSMRVVEHLTHPQEFLEIIGKLRREGISTFIENRFPNFRQIAQDALEVNINIGEHDKYNPNAIHFYSQQNHIEQKWPTFSGIIFPEGTIIEYNALTEEQRTQISRDASWIQTYIKRHDTKDIYGYIAPGTFIQRDSIFMNQFGIGEVVNGQLNIIQDFVTDPLSDTRVREKPDESIINDIYGGIVFYNDGRSTTLNLPELKQLIEAKTIDPDIQYIIEPNFLLSRKPGESGMDDLKRNISMLEEWRDIHTYNLILHLRTPRGIRIGYLNTNYG